MGCGIVLSRRYMLRQRIAGVVIECHCMEKAVVGSNVISKME